MFKAIFLSLFLLIQLSQNLFALEISLQGAKEEHKAFSSLHLADKDKFLCQEMKNDFDEVFKIVCAFSKSPSQKLQNIQNNFFKISTESKRKTFFLVIEPFFKMKLYPMVFDLTKDDTVFSSNVKLAKHWMIVGYQDKLPYFKEKPDSDITINFPYKYQEDNFPYVGSLDIQGNPVHVKRVGDVSEYIKIKKLYEDKEYEFTLELIDEIIQDYPNSLFMAELLFYKIRVHNKLKRYDELIEIAKVYLREYSSDENVPEVLSLIAKAYYKIGMGSDADYFFDRLFSEHEHTVYAKWGHIYKGEMLEANGAASRARKSYSKALKETDNIDVAVAAAYRLAQNLVPFSKIDEATTYVEKISKAKPEFFAETINESIDLMYDFVDQEGYFPGAIIAKALFENLKPDHEEYESLLRFRGMWLSKTEHKKDALVALNLYLKTFEDGIYSEEVQIAKDGLFFDENDENLTAKLANYDNLIKEYVGDSIGNKAIYEKAKLLIKNSMFEDALALEEQLLKLKSEEFKGIADIITSAAIGTMQKALEVKECASVLEIAQVYKIELSDEWDDGIYECAMKGADYELAKKIADKNLNSKDLVERKKWLHRYIKIDFETGNYSNVIEASKELITLIGNDKKSEYRDVYRYIFDTYQRLESSNKMIDAMADVEKIYGLDYIDIERYVSVMAVGSDKKDDNLVILYGEKIRKIQKTSQSYAQSPFVEFALFEAYNKKEDYNNALDVIKSLDDIKLKSSVRSRQKYLLGSVYTKLWRDDEAKQAYQESIDADKNSAWAKLAKGAQGI